MMDWFNSTKCLPPWSIAELQHKVDDAFRNVSDKGSRLDGGGGDEQPKEQVEYPLTDIGNAEHFASLYGDNLRYVPTWKSWLLWDGKRWAVGEIDKIKRLGMKFVRKDMLAYAKTIKDDDRSRYLKWIIQCQSEARVASMLSLASSLMACSYNEFDQKNNLFNVANGTIELDTLNFREHRREDMLTKISKVEYDPKATAAVWDAFLSRIFQDGDGQARQEIIEYVQQAVGYSMTADVSEQCLFVLWGKGANGKTTFVEAIENTLGEYAMVGLPSLMLKLSDGGRNTDDEADLFGVRMVSVSETEDGQRMNEAKIKRMVGSKRIKAMRKFQSPFEFDATHKLWLDVNFKPIIKGEDDGIGRRLRLIPFLVQIPDGEKDLKLGDKLRTEASGILNWMLQGLSAWIANGRKLKTPTEVADATSDYRKENDTFGLFQSDCIIPNDVAKVSITLAFDAYKKWADENGMKFTMTKIEFGKRMAQRGYVSKVAKVNGVSVRCFVGCELTATATTVDADVATADDDRPF